MTWDAIVVGAGPNGLAAAAALLRAGRSVLILEAADTPGGGLRSGPLTLPGFVHDHCAAIHPTAILSPFLSSLPLADHGLRWASPDASVAHPLDDGPAILLSRDLAATAASLGPDADRWRRLFEPFIRIGPALFSDLLAPLRFPKHPLAMARFAWYGLRSAHRLARLFEGERAKALFGGCAGHSVLGFNKALTAAVGLVFGLSAHLVDWPAARGGSQTIANALVAYCQALGATVSTGHRVTTLAALPQSRVVLFDLAPRQLLQIAGDALPAGYRRRLARYRYGPATFKLDWALSGPIPWRDPAVLRASTVHVGGGFDEIAASEDAMWSGQLAEKPYLIVCQQSAIDPTRAPAGQHTGYAYCHVPQGCTVDMTAPIEAQLERFAPGFKDLILARHVTRPTDFEAQNPAYVGGAVTGGVADLFQFFARPVARLIPYSTPNPRLFLCGASTPPGGGVHGMSGWWAAQAALRRLR